MDIKRVNFNFVFYLALIEAISFYFAYNNVNSFVVGFVPMLIVLALYKVSWPYFPVKLNNKKIRDFPILVLSVINGLFIMLLFFIQTLIPFIKGSIGNAVFGFLSVFLSGLILLLVYNSLNFKLHFKLDKKKVKLKKIDPLFAIYMGIFEAAILPIMITLLSIHSFLNGLISGFVGGIIGLYIVNYIMSKKPLKLSL